MDGDLNMGSHEIITSQFVKKSGDIMSGDLNMGSNKILTSQFVKKEGDTMEGDLNMGTHKINTSNRTFGDDDFVRKRFTSHAGNITAGKLHQYRLPDTFSSFRLKGNPIYLTDTVHNTFIRSNTYGDKTYAHLNGLHGVILSIGTPENNGEHERMVIRSDNIDMKNLIIREIKELKIKSSDSSSNGITLQDTILRFRSTADNNNSIRWFNGDLTTGRARLEMSTLDRLRLSTFRNKDGTYDSSRTYTAEKNQFVELLHDKFDMNNNRIINVSTPTDPNDAATKFYVDNLNVKVKYKVIIVEYKPTFWISIKFPLGFDNEKTTIQDLTGNGLTINNTVNKDLQFGLSSRITSTSTYGNKFTFFLKAKKTSTRKGRCFTSSVGNKLFGWWRQEMRCVWMESEVYGIGSNETSSDSNIHTFILVNDADSKNFYEGKTLLTGPTTEGSESWEGSVVIGQSNTYPGENSEFKVYEVMAFNKVLTEAQIFDIYEKIFA